jgi:hypothetical protein
MKNMTNKIKILVLFCLLLFFKIYSPCNAYSGVLKYWHNYNSFSANIVPYNLSENPEPGSKFTHLDNVLWAANPDANGLINVPSSVWNKAASTGAIELRFRPSREIRAQQSPPLTLNLIDSPLILLEIMEFQTATRFLVDIPDRSLTMESMRRHLTISHLKPQWYHLIVTWDAQSGTVELYLNGVLQMKSLKFEEWKPLIGQEGSVRAGELYPEKQKAIKIEVSDIYIRSDFICEQTAQKLADVAGLNLLDGEGRTIYDIKLDLSDLKLNLIYEANFNHPLNVEFEKDLFEEGLRVREPNENTEWVFEGLGEASISDGRLIVDSHGSDVVLWNTRSFPESFLLEFAMKPVDPDMGLAIVFFCASPTLKDKENIFSLNMPKRDGDFSEYTRKGNINSYHISYMAHFAPDEDGISQARRVSNMRKNDGFYVVAGGDDRVSGQHKGYNRIRILKIENKIRLEVNGLLTLAYDDNEKLYGLPVWGEGMIGLRQMQRTKRIEYESFRVYEVSKEKYNRKTSP